jgi:uncharacterized repeat protein (TIGR01451 family)
VNSNPVTVNFVSSPATYPPPGDTFPANNFVAAPILSLTYGTTPASSPVPDPTFPIATDQANLNPTACPSTPTAGAIPFPSNAVLNLPDGQYTLHYFATDCGSTEELTFTANFTNANANWAAFKTAPIRVDTVKPTISGPTFSPAASGNIYTVGQVVTVNYSCADDRSGVATCVGPVAAGGTINTAASQVGSHGFNVTATDNAGNTFSQSATYQIVSPADLALINLAKPFVKTGTNLTYDIIVLNLGPGTADNLVVTDTLPSGTTFVSAASATVTCTFSGCTDMTTGTPCAFSGGTVSCPVATLAPLNNLTGLLVKLVVKVTALPGSTIRDTASVTEANSDPHHGNNSFTAITQVTH